MHCCPSIRSPGTPTAPCTSGGSIHAKSPATESETLPWSHPPCDAVCPASPTIARQAGYYLPREADHVLSEPTCSDDRHGADRHRGGDHHGLAGREGANPEQVRRDAGPARVDERRS